MSTVQQSPEVPTQAWDVDGPDPVCWPGKNFELLVGTEGFIAPESIVATLCALSPDSAPWTVTKPELRNLENIFALERPESPWRVRARMACCGVHPEADRVEYVLDFKCLVGTQDKGKYHEREVLRGALPEVAKVIGAGFLTLDQSFNESCKFKTDYRVVSSTEVLDQVIEQAKQKIATI